MDNAKIAESLIAVAKQLLACEHQTSEEPKNASTGSISFDDAKRKVSLKAPNGEEYTAELQPSRYDDFKKKHENSKVEVYTFSKLKSELEKVKVATTIDQGEPVEASISDEQEVSVDEIQRACRDLKVNADQLNILSGSLSISSDAANQDLKNKMLMMYQRIQDAMGHVTKNMRLLDIDVMKTSSVIKVGESAEACDESKEASAGKYEIWNDQFGDYVVMEKYNGDYRVVVGFSKNDMEQLKKQYPEAVLTDKKYVWPDESKQASADEMGNAEPDVYFKDGEKITVSSIRKEIASLKAKLASIDEGGLTEGNLEEPNMKPVDQHVTA